jgi:hypothetical protein
MGSELIPMIIDERTQKCVAYLVEEDTKGRAPTATVFFVNAAAPEFAPGTALLMPYAVTARHAVEDVTPGAKLFLRVNLKDGACCDLPADTWTVHPNSDVAVCRIETDLDIDIKGLTAGAMWVGNGGPSENELVVGDDIAIIGLFTEHPGASRNLPVARFGHVALLPHEQIELELYEGLTVKTNFFVVEVMAWGGNSGSPVFLYWPHHREWKEVGDKGDRGPWLLGLLHGTFCVREPLDKPKKPPGEWLVRNNAGLAVVVPAADILATLDLPSLVEERKQLSLAILGK